jgi:hypothetical protein
MDRGGGWQRTCVQGPALMVWVTALTALAYLLWAPGADAFGGASVASSASELIFSARAGLFGQFDNRLLEASAMMAEPRGLAVAAPLSGGRVLIAGGWGEVPEITPKRTPLGPSRNTAEIFDPNAGQFSLLSNRMVEGRSDAVAAPLPGGRVLIAGGATPQGTESTLLISRTAEIFNPKTNRFHELTHLMTVPRQDAIAAPLPGGKVLIAGCYCYVGSDTAEVFDPRTKRFSKLNARMIRPRRDAAAVALPDGRILIIGGAPLPVSDTVEVFDPQTGKFRRMLARLTEPREHPVAVAIPKGKILIAGGNGETASTQQSAELLNVKTTEIRRITATMLAPRVGAVGVSLPDGTALVAGGHRICVEDRISAELFYPGRGLFRLLTASEGPPHYPSEHGYEVAGEGSRNMQSGCRASMLNLQTP